MPPGMEDGLTESMNWDDVWDRSAGNIVLPKELQAVRYVDAQFAGRTVLLLKGPSRPNDVNSIIYFSDNAPEGLSNSLVSLPAIKVSQIG